MNVTDPKIQIDHIDNNPLNNQRSNLRECTNQQNSFNKSKNKNNKSGFKGVYFDKYANKYKAQIQINNKVKHLGRFDTAEEAHEAYKKSALEYHGEFVRF